ncbi:MAG: trypsin-like peptidase domain-containing protein, partial [Armatimonadota bacterium]
GKRRLTSILVAAALIVAAQVTPAEAQGLTPEAVAKIKDAVVLTDVTLDTPAGEMGGSGSGFVMSAQGHIVTNAHVVSMVTEDQAGGTVVAESRSVQVVFHPGTAQEETFDAAVVREHHELDLALLQIEPDTPVYLELADSDAVSETSGIYACGHPLGLREISIRTGTVTAHRTWQGQRYVEHDASAEEGNSGGPVILPDTRVVGVHSMTLVSTGMLTKFAIPSNVVSAWLGTDPSEDPPPPIPGKAVRELLAATDLYFEEGGTGSFSIPYDNDVTITAHEYEDFLRLYSILGELPGGNRLLQGAAALEALRFNYTDPIGRLSLHEPEEGNLILYWECQVPMSLASGQYLRTIADMGANQVTRWDGVLRAEQPGEPSDLYPGGTEEELAAMTERLRVQIEAAELQYEQVDEQFNLPYDNEVTVHSRIYKGMVWTFSYTGGVPGATRAEQGQIAIALLKRNWDDPLGRLSLDGDYDLLWEAQVPSEFVTPDYFAILGATAATQVADFKQQYGDIPFNG